MPGIFERNPQNQWKWAVQCIYLQGLLNIIMGAVLFFGLPAIFTNAEGGGIYLKVFFAVAIATGIGFLVLGYFAQKRSIVALTIAVTVLALDILSSIPQLIGSARGGSLGSFSIFKFMFLIFMIRGFGAHKQLSATATIGQPPPPPPAVSSSA